jgi:hypothetical protein
VSRGGTDFQLRSAPLDGGQAETLLSFRVQVDRLPEEGVPSKSLYRVAPDGRHLAIRDWKRRVLFVRDVHGPVLTVEQVGQFYFSPDGRRLAVDKGRRGGPSEILVYDLETMTPRKLGEARHLGELDWLPGGVVASVEYYDGERDLAGQRVHTLEPAHSLVYFPLDGTPRTLATTPTPFYLIATAARATRVLYFTPFPKDPYADAAAWIVDAAAPEAGPRRLGQARFLPTNAELSPDGKQALFSTFGHVFHVAIDDGGVPQRIAEVRGVHSLWFSDDGAQYLWASRERAVLHRGGKDLPFPPLAVRGTKAESIRFLPDGAALLLMTARAGETVYRWDPAKGDPVVLYTAREQDADIDLFGGRLLRLTTKSDIHFVPIEHAQESHSDDVLPID